MFTGAGTSNKLRNVHSEAMRLSRWGFMQRFGIALAFREARVTYEPGWEDLLSIDPICYESVKSALRKLSIYASFSS